MKNLDEGIYCDGRYKYVVEVDTKKRAITNILFIVEETDNSAKTFTFLGRNEEYPVRDEQDDYCFTCDLDFNPADIETAKNPFSDTDILDKMKEKAEEKAIIEEVKTS